jgi:hypothetical protein
MTLRMRIGRLRDRLAGMTAPVDLLLHFSYHKCLTVYYHRVMSSLAGDFGFQWIDCSGDSGRFHEAATGGPGRRIVVLNNSDAIQWDRLPSYRGSHFIRDPRDSVVSGYLYHLWTTEAWCIAPDFAWDLYVPPERFQWLDPDPARRPKNISYQAYLKTLDPERGMILEMIFLHGLFGQLRRWNFSNPDVLELRYEDVVGNEAAAFERLFEHYRFNSRMLKRGLQIARKYSLANQPKGQGQHTRSGASGQWREQFTPRVKDLFRREHGDLLVRLGYEKDASW